MCAYHQNEDHKVYQMISDNLTIIELTMWPSVRVTPRTADVTKIAGYVCVRILMNR